MINKRPRLKEYFLDIAKAIARRATCADLQVGCVITSIDGYILSTGYNGAIAGEPHCKTKRGKCIDNHEAHPVIHAESNAVAFAARHGVSLKDSVAYITHVPCLKCLMLLKQAGIKTVITCQDKK